MTRATRQLPPTSRNPGAAPRRGRAGFSFMELVIVLSILGTVAAIAVPRYASSVGRYRAESAARRIAADLSLAGAKARAASSTQTVTFNAAAGTYTVSGVRNLDRPKLPYTVNLGGDPYFVRIAYADFGGAPQAQFDMFGSPIWGGKVTVYAGDYTQTVQVLKTDGSVSVQ